MRTHIRATRLLASVVVLLLAGCFKLSRQAPQLKQYVLSGASQQGAFGDTVRSAAGGNATVPARAGLVIGLRRLDLATYLNEPAIVVRRGVNELVLSEFHRWGGDLDEGINRAVAAHLAGTPPVKAVDVAPWHARARHDYLLQLHVSRFEGVADSAASDGRIHMLAGWDIIRALDGAVLLRASTDDRGGSFRVGDYTGLVTGLDAALARLARDIGACLARFPNDSTPPASCASVTGVGGVGR